MMLRADARPSAMPCWWNTIPSSVSHLVRFQRLARGEASSGSISPTGYETPKFGARPVSESRRPPPNFHSFKQPAAGHAWAACVGAIVESKPAFGFDLTTLKRNLPAGGFAPYAKERLAYEAKMFVVAPGDRRLPTCQ